jgi:hypothetical protein
MRPTVDEQLDGVRRLLDLIDSEDELSPAARELLRNAARLVKQVRGAWASTLPFLVEDNARLTALLAGLPGVVPGVSVDIAPVVGAEQARPEIDVTVATRRNEELRSLLARAIQELPRTSGGLAARTEIGTYLRWRVEADPT